MRKGPPAISRLPRSDRLAIGQVRGISLFSYRGSCCPGHQLGIQLDACRRNLLTTRVSQTAQVPGNEDNCSARGGLGNLGLSFQTAAGPNAGQPVVSQGYAGVTLPTSLPCHLKPGAPKRIQ